MDYENILLEKTFAFSVRIVKLYQFLINGFKINDLARQILRSGTSIGANAEETMGGISKKSFYHKISIVHQEARETRFWIRLLFETNYIDEKMKNSLLKDVNEIIKLTGKILSTLRKNLN